MKLPWKGGADGAGRTGMVLLLVLGFLLIAGTSASAGALITGRQIKDDAVKSRHLKNGTVSATDIRDGSLRRRDFEEHKVVGARGPQGEPGARGNVGPAGPPGNLGLEYRVTTAELPFDGLVELRTHCSAGKVQVGGGVGATDAGETDLRRSEPFVDATGEGWRGLARGLPDANGAVNVLRVWAICVPSQ
jgi:hypothetical protein